MLTGSVAQLEQALSSLRTKLSGHVNFIAAELRKNTGTDSAGVRNSLRIITGLTHELALFLPKIMASQASETARSGTFDPAQAHVWAELNRTSFAVRSWISQWPTIDGLVREQIPPKRRKLYRNQPKTEDIILAQIALSNATFDDMHSILNPTDQTDVARDYGCFADIALPQAKFLEHAHAAYRVLLAKRLQRPTRFLDVGCGSGFKVLTAARLFDNADGLEYDPAYARHARALFKRSSHDNCRVIRTDGLLYTKYDVYDVIYFYRPMRHIDQMRALEQQIITHASPGTLIIAPYQMFDTRYKSLGLSRIDSQLYITGTTQTAADRLRKCAEMTGPFINTQRPRGSGVWDPILSISQSMGFGI